MDEGICICFGFFWRPGGPVRVIHLHWPRHTIVNCNESARVVQLMENGK